MWCKQVRTDQEGLELVEDRWRRRGGEEKVRGEGGEREGGEREEGERGGGERGRGGRCVR